jgi:hypothetical protein
MNKDALDPETQDFEPHIQHVDGPRLKHRFRRVHRSSASLRDRQLDRIMKRPLWGEEELAVVLDMTIDALRHMKARKELPGVVQINQRKWFVHRDAFLEHIKQRGMPKSTAGRPRGSACANDA